MNLSPLTPSLSFLSCPSSLCGDLKQRDLSYLECANATKTTHIAYISAQDILKDSGPFPAYYAMCYMQRESL